MPLPANKAPLLDSIFSVVRTLTFHGIPPAQRDLISQTFAYHRDSPSDVNIGCQMSNDKGELKIEIVITNKKILPAPKLILNS